MKAFHNLLLAVSRQVIYLCAESTKLILLSNQNNLKIDTMFFSLPLLGIADGGGWSLNTKQIIK